MLPSQNAAFHKSRFKFGSKERFSLLLLEPGETFFKDYLINVQATPLSQVTSKVDGVDWHSAKLRVCSKSVVFEPPSNDLSALVKVLYRDMKNVPGSEVVTLCDGSIECRWIFESKRHTLMLENGVVKPFSSVVEDFRFEFVLIFSSSNDILYSQITKLWQASTEASKLTVSDQDHIREAIVDSALAMLNFDKKWLDRNENILLEENCKSIGPLTARPGLMVLTDKNLFFVPINDASELQKFEITAIKRALRRRYALQSTGVEIYCEERSLVSDIYVAFSSYERREIFLNKLAQEKKEKTPHLKSICVDKNLGELTTVTHKWRRREISNFDYIFYLNLLADRSINDIHQYPVFPWVISDYTSKELDLENPVSFRDLSKPVGALNADRLASLRERYEQMPDPKFLFGTHYSAPAFVLFYLVRLVPECVLCLQNGHLDQPDRTFHSIPELWNNVNYCPHDFKELIPEFFDGDGEFLMNTRKLDFGVRDDGARINHVILPPWAKGSAKSFIDMNRKALESEYVSDNLHHWVDLIFGYKQKGPVADQWDNLFHPLTYEGGYEQALKESGSYTGNTVNALKTQVLEFGQCPVQLFTKPHLPRTFNTNHTDQQQTQMQSILNMKGSLKMHSNNVNSSVVQAETKHGPKHKQSNTNQKGFSSVSVPNLINPNFDLPDSFFTDNTIQPPQNGLKPLKIQTDLEKAELNSKKLDFSASLPAAPKESQSVGRGSVFSSAWRKISGRSREISNPESPSSLSDRSRSSLIGSPNGDLDDSSDNRSTMTQERMDADEVKPVYNIANLRHRMVLSLCDNKRGKFTVNAMDVDSSGELVALALQDGKALVLSTTDSKPILTLRVPSKKPLKCCKFLNKKNLIVYGSEDGIIHVLSVKLCKLVSSFEAYACLGSISNISLSLSNALLAITFDKHHFVKLLSLVNVTSTSCALEERSELDECVQSRITYLSLDESNTTCGYDEHEQQQSEFHQTSPNSSSESSSYSPSSFPISDGGGSVNEVVVAAETEGGDYRQRLEANTLLIVGTESGDVCVVDALLNTVEHHLTLEFNDAILAAKVNNSETLLLACSFTQIKLINIGQKPYLPLMKSETLSPSPVGCALCVNVEQILYVHQEGSVLNKLDCLSGMVADKRLEGNSMDVLSLSRNNRHLAILCRNNTQLSIVLYQASN